MSNRASISLVLVLGMVGGANAVDLRGKVSNQAGKPVANAVVTLTPLGLADTTGSDGMYAIVSGNTAIHPSRAPKHAVSLQNGILEVALERSAPVKIEVFDTKGSRLKTEVLPQASSGSYRWDVGAISRGAALVLVNVTIDRNSTTFRHVATGASGSVPGAAFGEPASFAVAARQAAVPDSLRVSAKGYATKTVAVPSQAGTIDVKLDTVLEFGYPFKNAPTPSAGCGKANPPRSGTYKMTSAGLNRDYTLSVPDNYDPKKPYKLVFGMHWMDGNMGAVNAANWWQLKPLDTEKNIIWVAPQGYTDQMPWRTGANDNKDHIFFEELQAKVKSDFCIDTSRVFSIGFSFGAMFTNSLAQTHQKLLRAVVVFATADYNIYFPKNTGEPLAYMGMVGLSDELCPPSTGRSSRDRFVKNNKCIVPGTVKETTKGSGKHEIHDYEGCGNFPVKWLTFDGGHDDYPKDAGQSKTWVTPEVWKFINQF
ncbi:MAG TPA: hypothetical protein PK208_08070 [Fibrobacteria bacterium]|nr:hypothetical protein [Fibrobacteria bacterium]